MVHLPDAPPENKAKNKKVTATEPNLGDNRLPLLVEEIRRAVDSAKHHARATLARAIEAGEKLIEAKSLLPHGAWLPWLKENCGLSERQAQKYMRLATRKDSAEVKSAVAADLGIETLLTNIANPNFELPSTGYWKIGTRQGETSSEEIWIVQSYPHSGFYYLTYMQNDKQGEGTSVLGLRRPVRADHVVVVLRALSQVALCDLSRMAWSEVEGGGWAYNIFLFSTPQKYLDHLGAADVAEIAELVNGEPPRSSLDIKASKARATNPEGLLVAEMFSKIAAEAAAADAAITASRETI